MKARAAGAIKGDLDAELRLWTDSAALSAAMDTLGEELRFWLLTSDVVVVEDREPEMQTHSLEGGGTLGVLVVRCEAEKCQRCWHRRVDVGATTAHPGLCGRCVENVDGAGENRRVI